MNQSSTCRNLFAVVLVCSSLACRTARTGSTDTLSWRAPGRPAVHYDNAIAGAAALVGHKASPELAAAVESTARMRGKALIGDARLAVLAEICAQEQHKSGPPPQALIEFAMRHLGIYDANAELVVLDVPRDDARAQLEAALAPRLAAHPYTHYGAVLDTFGESTTLSLVLTERAVELSPVPRAIRAGEPIQLRGRVLGGASNPRMELSVKDMPRSVISAGSGPDFDVQIPTSNAGTYRIEIVGDGASGSRSLGKLAVYAGVPVPVIFKRSSGGQALSPSAVRADLIASINAERARAGLPALEGHPGLDEVASRHSADMRDHGFVSHESPSSGGPADRLALTGLGPSLVLENIVQGQDAATLHASTIVQPGQRSNLLHPSITHVGIGIAQTRDAHGTSLLVTELLVTLPAAIDVSTAAPTLLAAWNTTRQKRNAPTLSLDVELTRIAEEAAQSFVSTPNASEQSVIDVANAKLQRFSVAYRRVGAVLVLAHAIDEAKTLEPALDAEVRTVGVGVAQGNRPDRGGRVLAIMLVLAWPR